MALLHDTFGLTPEGARDFRQGVLFCGLANLVLMFPIVLLYLVIKAFSNHVVQGAPLPSLWPYLLGCLALLAVMALTQYLEYTHTYHVVYKESARKRIGLAEHLRRLPLSFFGRRDLADLTGTIMKDCSDQERLFMHVIPQLFGTGIVCAVMVLGCLVFDWRLALAAFWPLPVSVGLIALTVRFQQGRSRTMEQARLEMSDGVQEFLECAQEIRATNRQGAFLASLGTRLAAFERSQVRNELAAGVCITGAQALLKLGMATTVAVGAALLASGSIDFMRFVAYLLVATRAFDPVAVVFESGAELVSLRLSIRRTNDLMAEKPMEGAQVFVPQGHDLAFEGVCFGYEDSVRVLEDVSFTAREGEVTALVGPSGGGKSTAMKLAARFWDPCRGSVRLGGVDLAGVDPEALLGSYAEVFQDVVLFDDTVMENIRLGCCGATDEEVLAAAHAANCDEFVGRLPQGYATYVGENGARLSGGERQRISIARALLKDAPVVLLDEATASLDVESENAVQQALSRLLAGKTVLVIAHRMRTVLGANKVVVLKDGRVAEEGTPAELLERGGVFASMVRLQAVSGLGETS